MSKNAATAPATSKHSDRDVEHAIPTRSSPPHDGTAPRKGQKDAGYWALYFSLTVFILVVWTIAGRLGFIKPYSMATPHEIVVTAIQSIEDGTLLVNVLVSLIRVLEGFILGLTLAFILGVTAGLSRKFEIFIDLLIQIIRPIPPIAWIPLAILWFGIGEQSKIFIIFLGAFFPAFTNIFDGIRGIDSRYFELGAVYEIPRGRFIRHVVLPAALPQILTGIRLSISGAWLCLVAAELIGATSGLGYMLSNGRDMSRPDVVILAMLAIGLVGKLMDDLLRTVRVKLLRWV